LSSLVRMVPTCAEASSVVASSAAEHSSAHRRWRKPQPQLIPLEGMGGGASAEQFELLLEAVLHLAPGQ